MSRRCECLILRAALPAVLICCGATARSASAYPPEPGTAHPQIVLYTLEGDRTMALSKLQGKKVLLIHFASWSEESRKKMPAWHEKTKKLVADGKLVVLGVAHEQHADRCRLFAQWKGIDWPILHDPLNLIRVDSLPLVVGIDEHSIVRADNLDLDTFEETFVNKTFKAPKKPASLGSDELPNTKVTRRASVDDRSEKACRKHGDALVLAGQASANRRGHRHISTCARHGCPGCGCSVPPGRDLPDPA